MEDLLMIGEIPLFMAVIMKLHKYASYTLSIEI